MADQLAVEREYLKENQEELRQEYPGKYLLIKGTEVHGAYETRDQAIAAGVRQYPEPGASFLVRSVEDVADPVFHNPALSIGVPLSRPICDATAAVVAIPPP